MSSFGPEIQLVNLEKIIDGLPILPELFLLTATLVLLVYGIFSKKDWIQTRMVPSDAEFQAEFETRTPKSIGG